MTSTSSVSAIPTELTVHKQSRVLEMAFDNGSRFSLPFELMRVYSPSAEVRGHGPGQEVLQTGKRNVDVLDIEPVGNYAIRPVFSDGHDTGLYTWEYLYWLGENQSQLWEAYLQQLESAGHTRESGRDAPMAPAAKGAAAATEADDARLLRQQGGGALTGQAAICAGPGRLD